MGIGEEIHKPWDPLQGTKSAGCHSGSLNVLGTWNGWKLSSSFQTRLWPSASPPRSSEASPRSTTFPISSWCPNIGTVSMSQPNPIRLPRESQRTSQPRRLSNTVFSLWFAVHHCLLYSNTWPSTSPFPPNLSALVQARSNLFPVSCYIASLTALPLLLVSKQSRLDVYARVSLRLVLSFLSIRRSHQHSSAISHRRVAIVDYRGHTLLDCFVKPTLPVSDYRTNVTGISPEDLVSGECGTFIFLDGTSPTDASAPCVL